MSDAWERLQNSWYDAVKTGAVSAVEIEAYERADSAEEFEEIVDDLEDEFARGEYEDRECRRLE